MVEDAKATRDRRLAEALRANLKRRKAAAKSRNSEAADMRAGSSGSPQPTEGDS